MPPLRRRGRPGLIGTVARTAVIAGTASATANAVNHHSQQKAAESAGYAEQQAPVYAPPPPEPASEAVGPADSDLMTQLTQLAQLHQAGALTDEEFTAAKAKILAS
jgi:hypothetical protein